MYNEGLGKHYYEVLGITPETATSTSQRTDIELYLQAKAARAAGIHRPSTIKKWGHEISTGWNVAKDPIIASSLFFIPGVGPVLSGAYGAYALSEREKKEREKFSPEGDWIPEVGEEIKELNIKLIAGIMIAGVIVYSVVKS